MGNPNYLPAQISKQSPLKKLVCIIVLLDLLIWDKNRKLYERLYSVLDFARANMIVSLFLYLAFLPRPLGAPVAVASSLAITTTTFGIRCLLPIGKPGSSTGRRIAHFGMYAFPLLLPVLKDYPNTFIWITYLVTLCAVTIVGCESYIVKRTPIPQSIIPVMLALIALPILLLLSSTAVVAITAFYAVFILAQFSLVSVGQVLKPQLITVR